MGEGRQDLSYRVMSSNPLEQLEVTTRTIKRAQYEAFEFSLTAAGIRVRNTSHANPDEHEYLVEVDDKIPTSCTCPADETYAGACKHRIAVAIRRPVLEATTQKRVAPDGGSVQLKLSDQTDTESDETEPANCDCSALPDEFPCWDCYRNGRRELPE